MEGKKMKKAHLPALCCALYCAGHPLFFQTPGKGNITTGEITPFPIISLLVQEY